MAAGTLITMSCVSTEPPCVTLDTGIPNSCLGREQLEEPLGTAQILTTVHPQTLGLLD